MSTVTAGVAGTTSPARSFSASERVASILKLTFGLVPIAAGADKFMHLLVNWDQYLAPAIANLLPFAPHTFMLIVGVIEIIAGVVVLIRPRIGSLVVCLWLACIVLNLLIGGQYFDVAVRDIVMAIGAFCLFLLSRDR
ncbi:MAG TPA: hypothetical protein VF145_10295 [Chitinophagaceae bacterium]